MPKSKGRGGKNRRRAKNTGNDSKRELLFKEEGQEYAQVLKMLGNGRCDTYCFDGMKRLGAIRGKLIKRVWINAGDIVLVSLREFTKDSKKCDIVHKYLPDEAKKLKTYGEIPENVEVGTAGEPESNDPNVVFDELGDGEDDDDDDDEEVIPQRRTYDMPSSSDDDEEYDYTYSNNKEEKKVDSDDEEEEEKDELDDI